MVRGIRPLPARLAPHGPLDLVRQIMVFVGAFYLYRLVRGQVDGHAATAFEHARQLIDLERSLHVFVEPAVQAWAEGSPLIVDAASWIYINAQTSVTIGALAFLYVFRNDSFYFVRNMMVVAMGIALVGYVLFPTAPPRFLPEWGFTDSVSEFTNIPPDSVTVNALFNPYAAVPSMHVAFALMIGWPLARLARRRAVAAFWWLYPLLVTFVVVVTANHFLADAVLGAATAGASAWAAAWLARARPESWRFGPRSAEVAA